MYLELADACRACCCALSTWTASTKMQARKVHCWHFVTLGQFHLLSKAQMLHWTAYVPISITNKIIPNCTCLQNYYLQPIIRPAMSNRIFSFATNVANKTGHSPHHYLNLNFHFFITTKLTQFANSKLPEPILLAKHRIIKPYCQKSSKISFFGKSSIRHIQTVIRHMRRVANGLNNAVLNHMPCAVCQKSSANLLAQKLLA